MSQLRSRRAGTLFLAGAALVFGAACGRTAHFTVTRPAMLNAAAVGNTMTVGPIAAPNGDVQAAAEISSDIQNRIARSLNRSIRLLAQGGGVVITGAVLNNTYQERMERNDSTCSRQVAVGRDRYGNTQYQTQNYSCTQLRRVGQAHVVLQFTITNGTSGEVLFSQNYETVDDEVTTGTVSAYENNQPAYIDGQAMLHALRASNTAQFARVILPWQEEVSVDFEDCDGDNRCSQAFDMVRAGNLAGAEALYTQVVGNAGTAGAAVQPDQAERVGEALYNRGVTREYLGRYAQAAADLTRAIALRPEEEEWPTELQSVQRMMRDQEALRQQGATANEQQNVQQAGTP